MLTFQRLHPGEFIRAQHPFSHSRERLGLSVEMTNICYLGIKLLITALGQPVTDQVRLERPLFSSREA